MDELIPGLPEEVARECLVRVSYKLFGVAGSVSRLWKREVESTMFHRIRRSRTLTRKLAAFVQAEPAVGSAGPADKYSSSSTTSTLSYRLSVLDPSAGEWHTLPPVPGLPRSLPLFCQLAAVDRKLIVVGGWDPDTWATSDAVYVYDFLSGRWRRGARMPGPRRSFFACSAGPGGTTVFVAGGHDEEKNALRSAMAYDVAADEWSPLPDMAEERDECKGAFVDGRFHVVGGYPTERQGQFCQSAEAFDVATWEWVAVEEDWSEEEAACPMTSVADGDGGNGKFYLVRSGHVAVKECGGKWKEVAEVPEDAAVSTQLMTWQGKLLLLVGSGSHGGGRVAYLLEIATDADGGKKSKLTWHKIEVPEEYSGHVQAACCLEI